MYGFAAELRQDRQIDVLGQPGLAPPLHRHRANEAEAPPLRLAERLHFERRCEDGVHAGRRWNSACCSTSPDQ